MTQEYQDHHNTWTHESRRPFPQPRCCSEAKNRKKKHFYGEATMKGQVWDFEASLICGAFSSPGQNIQPIQHHTTSKCPQWHANTTAATFFPKGRPVMEPRNLSNGAKLAGSEATATHRCFRTSPLSFLWRASIDGFKHQRPNPHL